MVSLKAALYIHSECMFNFNVGVTNFKVGVTLRVSHKTQRSTITVLQNKRG